MSILQDLHTFRHSDGRFFLFDPESMLFAEVAPEFYRVLQQDAPALVGQQEANHARTEWHALEARFLEERQRVRTRAQQAQQGQHVLKRLTVLTTTACNLNCAYCYAEGGAYGGPVAHFKAPNALQAIENILQYYKIIENVQFFGGEPLLNVELIKEVCTFFETKYQAGEIPVRPSFGVTTNGTVWNEDLGSLLQRCRMVLNISLDGPPEVHDTLRVDRQGRGTFQRVWRTIQALRRHHIPFSVEVTYTPTAMRKGYRLWDIIEFLARHDIYHPHLVPAAFAPEDPQNWRPEERRQLVADYREATRRALTSVLEGRPRLFSYLTGLLRNLLLRIPQPLICAAGMHDLALDVTGNIYPCFMFIGQPRFIFQSALNSLDNDSYRRKVYDFYLQNAKEHRPECRTCWARNVCTGCLGWHAITHNGKLGGRTLHCAITFAVLEELMAGLARIRQSADEWQRFVAHYREFRLGSLQPPEVCVL